ncbi:MAG: glycosyl transferase family 2 [Bacteroidetes bacterium]|jgi:glycosyltransferase involved in cell wall biosynthesis|nr:glycosyl transferase family 2 [Bacteroidota bacterium]
MTIVAYIVFAFTVIQILVSFINMITASSLPKAKGSHSAFVSVLIPVRNEEKNIKNILNDLMDQEFKNIEIILFNDQSEDRTVEIINEYMEKDARIQLLHSDFLPVGWLGKNHACHSMSKKAKGEYLLFIDADVRLSGNAIGKAVSFSKKYDLSLISVFPKQIIMTPGEQITVPNMNYILVSLLPLIFVRKLRFVSMAAANGQFMFFRANEYHSIEPHQLMRNNKVEDILIARHYKKKRLRIACLLGTREIVCRMYSNFNDATEGFSKNVIEFFGNSFLSALIFWLVTTLGFIPVLLYLPLKFQILYIIFYVMTRVFVSVSSRQNIFYNLITVIPLQVSLGIFIYKAFINKFFRKYQWKGRSIT